MSVSAHKRSDSDGSVRTNDGRAGMLAGQVHHGMRIVLGQRTGHRRDIVLPHRHRDL